MPAPIGISTFEDIVGLDDEQIREIIARVGRDDLAVCLKAATEQLKDRVLSCMSQDEWLALTQFMEYTGPMLVTDVEHAVSSARSSATRRPSWRGIRVV
jgi:flagellar motor switch protein FliG